MHAMQKDVAEFCQEHKLDIDPAYRILDLISELGEASKEILKSTSYGRTTVAGASEALSDELGDVLFSLLCLSNTLEVDIQLSLERAIEKYKRRLASTKSPGSGR
jgi:NTP pyrophosphatase (non-canonical NTP hydrolase)